MSHLKPEECLNSVSEILTILKSTNQHEQVFSLIVDRIVRMYHCQTCAIVIIDPATEYLRIDNSYGLSLTFEKAFRRTITTGTIGKLLWTGKNIFIPDSAADPQCSEEIMLEHPFNSCVCMQIAIDQRTLGYLHADSKLPNTFCEDDIPILQSFADFAGLALNKSYLHEKNLRLDRIDHETDLEKYTPFLEKLSTSMTRAQMANESLIILLLDIDNYKQVALTYGYDNSKKLLKEWASLIKSHLRPMDAVGRYGFDEAIVMREKTTLEEGIAFAEKLRKAIEEKEFTQQKIHTTVSIGVAVYPLNASTEKDLLLIAKEALYKAQHAGRNRVCLFGK